MVAAMRRIRHAKIVATLGPATSSEAAIATLDQLRGSSRPAA
jgi:pyruvate kinase